MVSVLPVSITKSSVDSEMSEILLLGIVEFCKLFATSNASSVLSVTRVTQVGCVARDGDSHL